MRPLLAIGLLVAALAAGCAGAGPVVPAGALPARPAAEAGIEVFSVHLSAAGRVVDFRYRVVDAARAAAVLSRRVEPYAIDQATGARLPVPRAAKVGALRQSAATAEEGRVYFVLFGNAGRVVRPGSLVTVVLGDFAFRDLRVE